MAVLGNVSLYLNQRPPVQFPMCSVDDVIAQRTDDAAVKAAADLLKNAAPGVVAGALAIYCARRDRAAAEREALRRG